MMSVTWTAGLGGFAAGLMIAIVTTPVGVSGAVFLLPVQLSVLHVPSPAVTPTNLLFNVVSGPGALLRYARSGQLRGPLARQLIVGTVPGVIVGAFLRVFLFPDGQLFRLIAAAVLLPLGAWLCVRTVVSNPTPPRRQMSASRVTGLALCIGVVGGIYGIGGGSILGPILVGRGEPVAVVAPAALASTFAASIVGALTYTAIAFVSRGDIAPDWSLGLLCGMGGLLGGYLGARLQPLLPEAALRLLLGLTAIGVGACYVVQAIE
jgi:uncharacterized membrane protein YfcA